MKIVAIANQKGGVGKTTTAVNLGSALAELGHRILPADLDLAGAEVEIARMPNHLTRLAETLKPLQTDDTFDFVLLDCPPSLGILMSNALAAADELLAPIQCEYFALEG